MGASVCVMSPVRGRLIRGGPSFLALAALPVVGSACPLMASSFYDVFLTINYQQTLTQPPQLVNYFASARWFAEQDQAEFVSVTLPSGGNFPMSVQIGSDVTWAYLPFPYPTQTAMTDVWTPGDYVFSISGGTLGTQTGTLNVGTVPLWTPTVPEVTNLLALEGANPGVENLIEFTGFPDTPGADFNLTFVTLSAPSSTSQLILNLAISNTDTSVTIPAGFLVPGANHEILVYYSSRKSIVNAGLAGATATVGWDRVVRATFTAGEEPSQARCNPADIAYDDGAPLPPIGVPGGVNNGVTEGDYNAFFSTFFDAGAICDIANDDGSPLPPFGDLTTNNGTTEADYNLFFAIYFDGC